MEKKDGKFYNLLESFMSQINYCNIIESYTTDSSNYGYVNYDLLHVLFAGFYLTLVYDDYLIKQPNNSLNSKLLPEFMENIVKIIAVSNGSGYTIGNLHYKDECTVIEKIRNKLAHGDYVVQDGKIIFEENNAKGEISVKKILEFISCFEHNRESCIKKESRIKTLYLKSFDNIKSINENNFDDACNNIYKIEIVDFPMSSEDRSIEHYILIKQFDETILKLKLDNNKDNKEYIEKYLEKCRKIFNKSKIEITYTVKKLSELKEYEQIKSKYMDNIDLYRSADKSLQINTIINIANRLEKGEYQKFDIIKAIFINEIIIKKLKEGINLEDIVKEMPELSSVFLHHIDSTIIVSYLTVFNSLYIYGLEKELTKHGNNKWLSVYEGRTLDFSKLNIESLDDSNMLIEHTFDNYDNEIEKYESDNITRLDNLINIYENNLKNYLTNCKCKTSEKENQLIQKIQDVKIEKTNLINEIVELKQQYKKFNLDKYTRNVNIIYHIRNAIAHGNVAIESCCDGKEIFSVEIIFTDYLDGNIVYEKKLTVGEFISIFSEENVMYIYKFLQRNIKDIDIYIQDCNQQKKLVK